MSSLDKLSGNVVKELEKLATEYPTFESYDSAVRTLAAQAFGGEATEFSDDSHKEVCNLAAQYYNVTEFQSELSRYGQLAWGHARSAADPGPQPNAHLTGTPADGDYLKGDPDKAPWAG